MQNPRYQAIIRAATETRSIDFKAAMDWKKASNCARFELLRDIAAMANVGGGHIVVGRDGPALTTGSVTAEEAVSFDPTVVNRDVHKYLAPSLECRVEVEMLDGDRLVVIEVPEFDTSPLIFRTVGNCGSPNCKKSPHFLPGDVFIRSKAIESRRVTDAEEMQEIINRGVRKSRDDFVFALQRMLSSPQSVEEPLPNSPYDEEYEHEQRDFFQQIFYPWLTTSGHFDMTVKPVEYRADRLDLHVVPRKILEYAFIINRNGIFDAVPFHGDHEQANFVGGCRLRMMMPQWRRVEAISLHTSGLYRIVRAFNEDFEPSVDAATARLVQDNRTIWVDTFVEQVTMFHLLARNIARDLLSDPDEEIHVDLRIDGLAGRTLATNRMDPLQAFHFGLPGQSGTENVFKFPLRTTLRALEVESVTTARERCAKILWTFGLRGDGILAMQRGLLGSTQPHALPPSA